MEKVAIRYKGVFINAKVYDFPKYSWKKNKVKTGFPKEIAEKLCQLLPQDFEVVTKNSLTKKWENVK